jgi:hypothetical protein
VRAMSQEAVIYFKNGGKDWIEPVLLVEETETTVTIDNGFHKYDFAKAEVERIVYREYSPDDEP